MIDVDYLYKLHTKIHYFGLGFIQVKLPLDERWHFYTSKLPAIVPVESIHNHRYAFESFIIKGCLDQSIYEVVSGDTHTMRNVSCDPNNNIASIHKPVGLKKLMRQMLNEGSYYRIEHDVFHQVTTRVDTITKLGLGIIEKRFPQVVEPKGTTPVCPFSQQVPETDLWDIVAGMMK